MSEKTFYSQGNVTVTDSRFIVGNQTFALGNITSVTVNTDFPSYTAPIVIGSLGIIILTCGGSIFLGILLIAGAILWYCALTTKYMLVVGTAGSEKNALESENKDYITTINDALNEAIVYRSKPATEQS